MTLDSLMEIVAIVPPVYEWCKPYLNMSVRRSELRELVGDLRDLNTDLDNVVNSLEQRCQTRRRQEVLKFLKTSSVLVDKVTSFLDESEEEGVYKHVRCVPLVERYLCDAQKLVGRGRTWTNNALAYNDVKGDKLPVRDLELMGKTAGENLESVVVAITTGRKYNIGIYGCLGAGKKSLMKHIYNRVLQDHPDFKAVFWAVAPENPRDDYALQEKVSEGMWFDIKHDIDCVRRASFLEERFVGMAASGKVILFLCDLREEFRAYEVLGISASNCVLVFTAPSLDVCNRMKCDKIIKVDHLPIEEAEELFMREVGLDDDDHHKQEIKDVASQIAKECARMPLAIRVIANSMRDIKSIEEWRNRLNELMERITLINNEEDKIVELLKFGYTCLEDPATRKCFNVAAQILAKDVQLTKETIIEKWRDCNLIGHGSHSNDQGHTMLNQLERMCLLEINPSDEQLLLDPSDDQMLLDSSDQLVTMNKWIRKIASSN